ncbi:MAG TPA: helix-turn-helix transcriptional regulator [Anaerolineae bacterium]|nr:helix-turn-helix transcriptional regulator [Anaerolineae bacterium]
MRNLSTWLLEQLEQRRWDVGELARRSYLSEQTIYSLLNPKTPNVRSDTLLKLIRTLKISLVTFAVQLSGMPEYRQPETLEIADLCDLLGDDERRVILGIVRSLFSEAKDDPDEI